MRLCAINLSLIWKTGVMQLQKYLLHPKRQPRCRLVVAAGHGFVALRTLRMFI